MSFRFLLYNCIIGVVLLLSWTGQEVFIALVYSESDEIRQDSLIGFPCLNLRKLCTPGNKTNHMKALSLLQAVRSYARLEKAGSLFSLFFFAGNVFPRLYYSTHRQKTG